MKELGSEERSLWRRGLYFCIYLRVVRLCVVLICVRLGLFVLLGVIELAGLKKFPLVAISDVRLFTSFYNVCYI